MTQQQLTVTAEVIRDVFTPSMIRDLCATNEGQEILRLIVRDDLAGAGGAIVAALWFDL
jgi:hypothetical protein